MKEKERRGGKPSGKRGLGLDDGGKRGNQHQLCERRRKVERKGQVAKDRRDLGGGEETSKQVLGKYRQVHTNRKKKDGQPGGGWFQHQRRADTGPINSTGD